MKYSYMTSGTCCRQIDLEIENGKIKDVKFIGGCNGNLQGVAALVKGMATDEVVERLSTIRCNGKSTSCPHQLSLALASIPS